MLTGRLRDTLQRYYITNSGTGLVNGGGCLRLGMTAARHIHTEHGQSVQVYR